MRLGPSGTSWPKCKLAPIRNGPALPRPPWLSVLIDSSLCLSSLLFSSPLSSSQPGARATLPRSIGLRPAPLLSLSLARRRSFIGPKLGVDTQSREANLLEARNQRRPNSSQTLVRFGSLESWSSSRRSCDNDAASLLLPPSCFLFVFLSSLSPHCRPIDEFKNQHFRPATGPAVAWRFASLVWPAKRPQRGAQVKGLACASNCAPAQAGALCARAPTAPAHNLRSLARPAILEARPPSDFLSNQISSLASERANERTSGRARSTRRRCSVHKLDYERAGGRAGWAPLSSN